MALDLNVEELDAFNDMVDQITEDIEAGRTKANPLKPQVKTIAEIDAEDVTVKESATESGEPEAAPIVPIEIAPIHTDEVDDNEEDSGEGITINGKHFNYCEEGDVIGRPGKSLVVVSNDKGEVVFGSAAVAASQTGFNPTTMRSRCDKEYVDSEGCTWTYRDR